MTPADAQTVQTICTGDEQGTIICLQFVVGTGTSILPSAPPSPPLINPIGVKFFPGGFHPAGVTDPNSRFGAVLFRGDGSTPGFLTLLRVSVDPANPQVLQVIRQVKLKFGIGLNRFFAGRAEAVLAVSQNDPSNSGNGTVVFAVSDKTDDQITKESSSTGEITIVRNAWGNLMVDSEQPFMSAQVGVSGPIAVAINDMTSEAIVVEQTITNASDPHFGKSPVRVFGLAAPSNEARRVYIDGVGDSAAMAIDQATNKAFIARSFSVGGVAVVNLNTMTQEAVAPLYPGGEAQPAPGLELDLMAGKGYLAAPQLGGVKEFSLGQPLDQNQWRTFQADVFYHSANGTATGLQEISVSNINNSSRNAMVISRSDPIGFPNRTDRVTGIDLNTGLENLLGTNEQTEAISFVPTNDASNLYFLRIKVKNGVTGIGLKKFILQ